MKIMYLNPFYPAATAIYVIHRSQTTCQNDNMTKEIEFEI